MAITVSDYAVALPYVITDDTDADMTGIANVRGTSCTLHAIEISGNSAGSGYLRVMDSTSVVPGTTVPKLVIYCKTNTDFTLHIPDGLSFSSGISYTYGDAGGVSSASYSHDGAQNVSIIFLTT